VVGRTDNDSFDSIAALLLGLAEIEHGNIRERQKAGIEAAKARGVYTGRTVGSTKANPGRARELKKKGLSMKRLLPPSV
jgi:DNA invertase Pin-like site-specific DNA recombinase